METSERAGSFKKVIFVGCPWSVVSCSELTGAPDSRQFVIRGQTSGTTGELLAPFRGKNGSLLKDSGGCRGSYLCGTVGHADETRRPDPDPRKPLEPAQGLGRPGKLAGLLRHLLEAHLHPSAQGGIERRR